MTSEEHLRMQITKFYLDSLHEAHDSPNSITYRTLMDVNAVVVAEREKRERSFQNLHRILTAS